MKNFTLLFFAFFFAQFLSAQIVNIPDANLKTALLNHSPVIDTNGDNQIQISEAQALTGLLNLNYKQISDVSGIENFNNITELNLHNNEFTSFPVISSMTSLQTLNLCFNNLTSVDVSGFTALETLYIQYSDLSVISDSDLPKV